METVSLGVRKESSGIQANSSRILMSDLAGLSEVAMSRSCGRPARVQQTDGKTYFADGDPRANTCTWENVWGCQLQSKEGRGPKTRERYESAIKDAEFNSIRNLSFIHTTVEMLYQVLRDSGKPCTNMFLNRFHSFALKLGWDRYRCPLQPKPADRRGNNSPRPEKVRGAARRYEDQAIAFGRRAPC